MKDDKQYCIAITDDRRPHSADRSCASISSIQAQYIGSVTARTSFVAGRGVIYKNKIRKNISQTIKNKKLRRKMYCDLYIFTILCRKASKKLYLLM